MQSNSHHGRWGYYCLGYPGKLEKGIGGDILTVSSAKNDQLKRYIEQTIQKKIAFQRDGTLQFEVRDSASFVPQFIARSPVKILSISARKPILDDVFLDLTGKEIREGNAGAKELFKQRMIHKIHSR